MLCPGSITHVCVISLTSQPVAAGINSVFCAINFARNHPCGGKRRRALGGPGAVSTGSSVLDAATTAYLAAAVKVADQFNAFTLVRTHAFVK